uniref:Uncharacterized protein n=1 Tax=Salix viminalis TaxID=40686 RepID=A0A6N2MEH0_SALVM
MGIVTMVRISRNMPRKLAEVAAYGSQVYYADEMAKSHVLAAPSISTSEYKNMMLRMAEMEEKLNVLSSKPQAMPLRKRIAECCDQASRFPGAGAIDGQKDTVAKQQELLAYIEKKRRKRIFLDFELRVHGDEVIDTALAMVAADISSPRCFQTLFCLV